MADDAAAAVLGSSFAAAVDPVDAEAESYLQLLDGAVTWLVVDTFVAGDALAT